jgi:glycosyltransferase involved in cell wall biosynthesis
MAEPLVSILIPTFNRAATLRRAAESALAQTHRNLEIVVSDDGSTDDTETVCQELCARDARVRYLRSPTNEGLAVNHNVLFKEMHGDYAMLLSDDDWLERNYVESCLGRLRSRPDHVLVCGLARYVDQAGAFRDAVALQLDQQSAAARVVSYLRNVDENGLLYGLMPRAVLARAAPMRSVLANDWLLVAAVVAQGKAATLGETHILREPGGTSADFVKLATTLGQPRWQALIPHLVIAWEVLKDVGSGARAYDSLGPVRRFLVAPIAAVAAIRWRGLAWHMTMPFFAALGRVRGGGWLWRAFLRFTRLMGRRSR